jgi:hypothetical protein
MQKPFSGEWKPFPLAGVEEAAQYGIAQIVYSFFSATPGQVAFPFFLRLAPLVNDSRTETGVSTQHFTLLNTLLNTGKWA